MTTHELKCWPNSFEAMARGTKPFKLRQADRPFQRGDVLVLREYLPSSGEAPGEYTGRYLRARVLSVLEAGEYPGLAPGYVIMGIGSLNGHWGVEVDMKHEEEA